MNFERLDHPRYTYLENFHADTIDLSLMVSFKDLWNITLNITEEQGDTSKTTLKSNINDSTIQHTWSVSYSGSVCSFLVHLFVYPYVFKL